MEVLFQQTNTDLQQVHLHLQHLERATNESNAQPLFQTVHQKIREIQQNLDKLNQCISKEQLPKRRIAKYRYDQLKFDFDNIEASIGRLQVCLTNKWQSAAERDELLTRRFKPNETLLDVDDSEYLLNDRLKQSHTSMDEMISQGTAVLNSIRSQGVGLRGIRSKVINIGETLGLSTTTLRMIEKRLEEDYLLFISLVICFIIFMFAFYWYWKN